MNYSVQQTTRIARDTVQENRRQTVDVEQAAVIKGVKPETLRKRLQRGQEHGFKGNDGKWNVYVSDVQDTSRTVPDLPRKIPDNSENILRDLLNEVRERLDERNEVIDYLKKQILEKDQALRERDGLIRDLISRTDVEK